VQLSLYLTQSGDNFFIVIIPTNISRVPRSNPLKFLSIKKKKSQKRFFYPSETLQLRSSIIAPTSSTVKPATPAGYAAPHSSQTTLECQNRLRPGTVSSCLAASPCNPLFIKHLLSRSQDRAVSRSRVRQRRSISLAHDLFPITTLPFSSTRSRMSPYNSGEFYPTSPGSPYRMRVGF
jgi:hypothetical protein